MSTPITLHTELSREKLLELRAEIDALIGGAFAPTGGSPSPVNAGTPSTSGGSIEDMARRLESRLNGGIRDLVLYIVNNHADGQFTWDDIAAGMGKDLGTIKSWHRSLSKPLGRLSREFSSVPPLIKSVNYDGRNHYVVGRGWKEAITKTWA